MVWSIGVNVTEACRSRFRVDPNARKEMSFGEHVSLAGRSDTELGQVFTMLRSPGNRLSSAYHFEGQLDKKGRLTHRINVPNNSQAADPEQICNYVQNSTFHVSARGAQVGQGGMSWPKTVTAFPFPCVQFYQLVTNGI